jgi:excisionase family DNA binding protein
MLSKPLLTTHDVAELLKIKEATVRAWIRAGELPAIQFHREWRVAFKDLEHFVGERRTGDPREARGEQHKSETELRSSDRKLAQATRRGETEQAADKRNSRKKGRPYNSR